MMGVHKEASPIWDGWLRESTENHNEAELEKQQQRDETKLDEEYGPLVQ
jgi:hypothetical protein